MSIRSSLFRAWFIAMAARCRQKIQQLQNKLHALRQRSHCATRAVRGWSTPDKLALTPIDGLHPNCATSSLEEELVMDQKTLTVTQWTLDDAGSENSEKNKKITVVEVEFFPTDPYLANAHHPKRSTTLNYTIPGEDPNLRITHYPPSNRLH